MIHITNCFYITTPIYYVNGKPHIGHAYTTIVADIIARWRQQLGEDIFLLTGTDEHGQKVLEKAVQRGMEPQEHVDDMVANVWAPFIDSLQVNYHLFSRTTSPEHERYVQRALTQLHEAGLLYQGKSVGWYDVGEERFLTERQLVDGKPPEGVNAQRIEEENWFFRMSQFQERLISHIEENPQYIQPETRRNEILGFLRDPLKDLCISRPAARMSWGIPLPFDEKFVTYVWFDALLNYISHPAAQILWPASVHLVGKDIVTTHAVYWSTMLMALEAPLPKQIFAHGWWLDGEGRKMSKSKGNVVEVQPLIEEFGLDAVRFYLARSIEFGKDGKISRADVLDVYNRDLANSLGNLVHRTAGLLSKVGGKIPAYEGTLSFADAMFQTSLHRAFGGYKKAMEGLRLQEALEHAVELVQASNKYIDDRKPWALIKENSPEGPLVLRLLLEAINVARVLLAPVMPEKMEELRQILHANSAEVDASFLVNSELPLLHQGHEIVSAPLFPRILE